MQYYLVAPFVFLAFWRARHLELIAVAVLAIFLFFLPRYWSFASHFDVAFAFVAGFSVNLILMLYPIKIRVSFKAPLLMLGVLSVHLVFNVLWFFGYVRLADLAAVLLSMAAVLVCEAAESGPQIARKGIGLFLLRFAMLTGFLTYGIYLWHYVIIRTRAPLFDAIAARVGEALALNVWGTSLVYHVVQISTCAVLSYLLAYLTFIFIECRFRPNLYSDVGTKYPKAV